MILPIINSPICTRKLVKLVAPSLRQGFTGLKIQTEEDTFTPNKPSNTEYFKKTYNNIQNNLEVLSDEDIDKTINKISNKFPDLKKDEILGLLHRLTSYSSYKSMNYLAKSLSEQHILGIYDYLEFFVYREKKIEPQNDINFFKNIFPINYTDFVTEIPKGIGIPLGCIMDYLTCFKYAMDYRSQKLGLILDKNSITMLEELKKSSPNKFKEDFLENKNLIPIYIDDFENSYNFLNQGKAFDEIALKAAQKYDILKKSIKSFPTEKIPDIIFNFNNLNRIKELGFTPIRIPTIKNNEITSRTIAENLNPVIPSESEFEEAIKKIVEGNGKIDNNQAERLLLDYLNTNLAIYSSRSLSKKLQLLHEKILENVRQKGYSEDNIYYTILHPNKSFGLITYQFQKANNISNDKIVYWIGSGHQLNIDFKLPEKSTIVVLDDCFISGNTIMYEMLDYGLESKGHTLRDKNVNLLFASVLATDAATNRVKKNIKYADRENNDDIISIDTRNINWIDNINKKDQINFLKLIRQDKHIMATTAVVFPYMGSDTNAPGLRNLFALFVPNKNYLHNEVKTDDFFSD